MKKRFLSVLLAAVLAAVSCCGCAYGDGSRPEVRARGRSEAVFTHTN